MDQSLHFNKVKEDIHVGFNKLIAKLNKKGAPYALSLANRLYGEKTYQFVEKDTKPVQMMNLTAEFPLAYIPEINCQILEMPYTGKELRMLIALRNGIDDGTTGLEKLEQNLTYETSWSGHALLRWIM
ncbi:hypothetical protein NFI96_009118 [Prochilodus magdalenae]|nr:hypothetical protein NFI96_009118 [Prochilodus magdalenae]